MRHPFIRSAVMSAAMLVACAANAEDPKAASDGNSRAVVVNAGCHLTYQHDESGRPVPSWLQAGGLAFEPVEVGQTLPLNTLIVMPSPAIDDEALLIIEFSRQDLNESFVEAYFFDRQALIPVDHPYARMGVEYILTDERLILKIHPDMVLHLRDDSTGIRPQFFERPEYQRQIFNSAALDDIFRRDDVVGTVIFVSGDVYGSADPRRVRSDFHGFHAGTRASAPGAMLTIVCGSTPASDRHDALRLFPQSYPPRVVAGR